MLTEGDHADVLTMLTCSMASFPAALQVRNGQTSGREILGNAHGSPRYVGFFAYVDHVRFKVQSLT